MKKRLSFEPAAIHDQVGRKGAGVLLLCLRSKRILLGKRGTDCASPLTWAPFGGMVEDGEDPAVAALRELHEEAGVLLRSTVTATPVYVNRDLKTGFEFHTFVATCQSEPVVTINHESSGYGWFFPYSEDMPQPLHPGFAELLLSPLVQSTLRVLL